MSCETYGLGEGGLKRCNKKGRLRFVQSEVALQIKLLAIMITFTRLGLQLFHA